MPKNDVNQYHGAAIQRTKNQEKPRNHPKPFEIWSLCFGVQI